jgi:RNA-directed DNA polymerase
METLMRAWCKVKANKGVSGIDRVSIERFEANSSQYLKELQFQLRNGSYQPLPVKRVYIDKGNGQSRPLGIPIVKDRVVQAALKMVLEPIFEKEFFGCELWFSTKARLQGCSS